MAKRSTFFNHAIYNIFSIRYYKLLSRLGAVIQIFSSSNLDSLFSKVFSETKGKNGIYRCFSVNCLFENFSLNLPFLTTSPDFLKKRNNLTPSSLSHTFIANTNWLIYLVHLVFPLFWIPFWYTWKLTNLNRTLLKFLLCLFLILQWTPRYFSNSFSLRCRAFWNLLKTLQGKTLSLHEFEVRFYSPFHRSVILFHYLTLILVIISFCF